jgi:hypothetical protein
MEGHTVKLRRWIEVIGWRKHPSQPVTPLSDEQQYALLTKLRKDGYVVASMTVEGQESEALPNARPTKGPQS